MTVTARPRRRDDQSNATREVLLLTAERLFAERGVYAVSNRQISEAAGQGNNTAVGYHFGTKEDLIRAIVSKHTLAMAEIRARLIDQIQDRTDLREWVRVAVRTVTEHMQQLGQPSWYARFIAQIAADPTLHGLDDDEMLGDEPTLRELRAGMKACLPELTAEVNQVRSAMTRHLINQASVDRERSIADHPDLPVASWDTIADDLVEAVVALWRAPVVDAPSDAPSLATPHASDPDLIAFGRQLRAEFGRFMLEYQFAVDEVLTKVTILQKEFLHLHRYNPIEHVSSRVKEPAAILEKTLRKGGEPSLPAIRERITDIAGVRVTCSFIADTYRILEALTAQEDIEVVEVMDYIATPKPNGYKSIHAIVRIPVFLSSGPVRVPVEIQIRTAAMDFWASLEHKIFYKYRGDVPPTLRQDLARTAAIAEQLDHRMAQLHDEVHGPDPDANPDDRSAIDDALIEQVWTLSAHLRSNSTAR